MSSWDSEKNCLCFLCIQSAHNSILVFLILTPFYSLSFYTNQNPIKMVTIFSFVPRGNLQHFTMMFAIACMCPQSFLTLCNPMDCSHQAPLSMGFPRQEYCSGLPFPSPGDLPDPGIEPAFSCISCIGRQILYHCATWEGHFQYHVLLIDTRIIHFSDCLGERTSFCFVFFKIPIHGKPIL